MALSARVIFSASTNYADVNLPELVSAEILADGQTLRITFSKAVTFGAGGNGGFTLATDGASVTWSYSAGDGAAVLNYTGSRVVLGTETITDFDYVQPGDGVIDLSDRELASFSNQHALVVNSSGEDGSSWLLAENYEGDNLNSQDVAGYDTVGVYASSASINPRNTSNPTPYAGTYSSKPGASSRVEVYTIAGSPRNFFWAGNVGTSYGANGYFKLYNGWNGTSGTEVARIEMDSSARLKLYHGSASTSVSSAVNFDAWRLWWLKYTPSDGSNNGVLTLWRAADETKPGSPFLALTNGTSTAEVNGWQVGGLGAGGAYDKLRASVAEIESNPS